MAAVDARDAVQFDKRGAAVIHRLLAVVVHGVPPEVRKEAYEWLLEQANREIEAQK